MANTNTITNAACLLISFLFENTPLVLLLLPTATTTTLTTTTTTFN